MVNMSKLAAKLIKERWALCARIRKTRIKAFREKPTGEVKEFCFRNKPP